MKRIILTFTLLVALATPVAAQADQVTLPNVFINETWKCLDSCVQFHTAFNNNAVTAAWFPTTPGKATTVGVRNCPGSVTLGTVNFGANPTGGSFKVVTPPLAAGQCITLWAKTQLGEGGFTEGHRLDFGI